MANKIQTVTFYNNGSSKADVAYDVLDLNGVPTKLGGIISVTLTAPQSAAILAIAQGAVDAKVLTDLTAARAQLANTAAT